MRKYAAECLAEGRLSIENLITKITVAIVIKCIIGTVFEALTSIRTMA